MEFHNGMMNAKTQVIGKFRNLEQARLKKLAGELNSLFVLFFPLLKGYSQKTGLTVDSPPKKAHVCLCLFSMLYLTTPQSSLTYWMEWQRDLQLNLILDLEQKEWKRFEKSYPHPGLIRISVSTSTRTNQFCYIERRHRLNGGIGET